MSKSNSFKKIKKISFGYCCGNGVQYGVGGIC